MFLATSLSVCMIYRLKYKAFTAFCRPSKALETRETQKEESPI